MIGSLMYLTASRLDIMFAIYACARHQVTPKECHLHAIKWIFRYLKGHPKLGLWYPKESPFDLVSFSDSDYGLVQIYVDDIIFGATNKALCQSFEKLMNDKFQMSSMGELTFFLGLQYSNVHQPSKEISIDELKIMMQSYFERMKQLHEQEDLLAEQELREQEQAAQEKEEPPQNSDIHQLTREVCGIKVCEEQKQNIEDTTLELLEEVKNIVEQPTKSRTRITESLQNFRVIHKKSSMSLNNSTILETKSDEVINSSVKNLVQIPSEYEVTSDNESECDVPIKDESSPIFTTFSNPTVDYNNDFTSSDDELLSKEDIPMENFKIYLNLLFYDEEINSNKIDPHYFNAKSNLIESLSNRDILFDSSPKFDYLEEFSGELMPTSIINEERIKREHEEYISLMENNDSISLPENESSNFDHHDDPSFPRPPPEQPDVEIFFEPDLGVLTTKVVKGISEHYVLIPNILPTLPTFDPLYPVYDTLLLFSSENEDKVFKPGIPFYLLVSYQDKTTFDVSENPMMMYGGEIPLLDVLDLHTIPMDK
nr:hypothetical protein [Tanacetum cinerariifolium]